MINVKALKQKWLYDWPLKHLNGHVSFRLFGARVTFYGFNAMWLTLQIHTRRWGYVCLRLPSWHPKMKWKFYVSPNATPWAATLAFGPGHERGERQRARARRIMFGHNFDTEENWLELCAINDKPPYP